MKKEAAQLYEIDCNQLNKRDTTRDSTAISIHVDLVDNTGMNKTDKMIIPCTFLPDYIHKILL